MAIDYYKQYRKLPPEIVQLKLNEAYRELGDAEVKYEELCRAYEESLKRHSNTKEGVKNREV